METADHKTPIAVEVAETVISDKALEVIESYGVDLLDLLRRHAHGDWGGEDEYEMDICLRYNYRVRSSFPVSVNDIVVITTNMERTETKVQLMAETMAETNRDGLRPIRGPSYTRRRERGA